jgi:hypothetical protein
MDSQKFIHSTPAIFLKSWTMVVVILFLIRKKIRKSKMFQKAFSEKGFLPDMFVEVTFFVCQIPHGVSEKISRNFPTIWNSQ